MQNLATPTSQPLGDNFFSLFASVHFWERGAGGGERGVQKEEMTIKMNL
jgi:hypothetical protein